MPQVMGMTCGIGSMMLGAQHALFDPTINIEWRKYYHTGTFELNFPGSRMVKGFNDMAKSEIKNLEGIDLMVGHTECGNFSNLSNTSRAQIGDARMEAMKLNAGDIPEFINAVEMIKPKYFFMDNLPGSLEALPLEVWRDMLTDYRVTAQMISNYHYGNIQKHRYRLFYMGHRKDVPFKFIPGEFMHHTTTYDVCGDLGEEAIPEFNHVPLQDNEYLMDGQIYLQHGDNLPIRSIKQVFRELGEGKTWQYYTKAGVPKLKAGYVMTYRDSFCHTLTGRGSIFHWTGRPLTIRERARIQGLPDSFKFIGRENKVELIKQTGKCMPIQFCHYLAGLIHCYIDSSFCPPDEWPNYFYEIAPAYYTIREEDRRFLGYSTCDTGRFADLKCEEEED